MRSKQLTIDWNDITSGITGGKFEPRPYQTEALDALHDHICIKKTNPCVVIPTGGGKSALMAWIIEKWKEETPWMRVVILAHRKELIEQNANELRLLYPSGNIGIFSAALKQRDYEADILFASIDSVYKRTGEFAPWDVIFVDEAHRIPPKGEGKYRTFIKGSMRFNSQLKVIGWTATPFRMSCGAICHEDHILNEICYEAKVTDLIRDGHLSPLRSKVGERQPDLREVRRNSGGDYIIASLSEVTNKNDVVTQAVSEAVRIIRQEERKSSVFFCVNVAHAHRVSNELMIHGIKAPVVTGVTSQLERDRISWRFRNGKLHAVCNVNVYTEGFNATCIDCIVLLRPTLSAGLFSQMVGRGLRLHLNKRNCLVLDFAGCIEEHGPIDLLGGEPVVMATCQACRESFSRAIGACPACGWVIPPREVERLAAVERERRMHGKRVSKKAILSDEPVTYTVNEIFVSRHNKEDGIDSVCVQYRCGTSMYREWICFDHWGYAGQKAQRWWGIRMGQQKKKVTVNAALENFLLIQALKEWTKTVTVKRNGKYWEIVGYNNPL